jgi:hypothetical protein
MLDLFKTVSTKRTQFFFCSSMFSHGATFSAAREKSVKQSNPAAQRCGIIPSNQIQP